MATLNWRPAWKVAKRWLYIVHRWLGVAACLLFVLWFVSGVTMMYVRFPRLHEAERVAHSAPIDWARVRLDPQAAIAAAGAKAFPADLTLAMWGGEPVYRLIEGRKRLGVSAVDGRVIGQVDVEQARTVVAAAWPNASPRFLRTLRRDQWTVAQAFDAARPLHLFALDDAARTQIYVGAKGGEIVLDTNRTERFWNWLGAVPHWLYFTALRALPGAWTQVVLWTSGLAMVSAVSGLWIGLLRVRIQRRYAGGRMSPYRGWMTWHHLVGLAGGLFVLTWVFSGWMSMGPNGWGGPGETVVRGRKQWMAPSEAAYPLDSAALRDRSADRLARFYWLGERPLILVDDGQAKAVLDPVSGRPLSFTDDELFARAAGLVPGARLVMRDRLTEDDAYWYGHHEPAPLPVLRAGFDDPARSWFYIDPTTGRMVGVADRSLRLYRWTFSALHSLDFQFLLARRPLWDIVVWLLSALGLTLSVTGVVIGWRRIKADLAKSRLRLRARGVP
ncbi:PepSY-associated TM helix domain-containing protein [Caulobacter sp.]|uniref:PepSY-associated TM helix domain-containing protein n=1 Tax=Caulobacter sp. TaxID=78 RepID=UPI0031D84B00